MTKNFTLEKQSLNCWIRMNDDSQPEVLKKRCTLETIKNAVKSFGNVEVISAEIEIGKQNWVDNFHVVLAETAPGGSIVTINVWAPLHWNERFLACAGGGLRTFHMYEILGQENRITLPSCALSNGFATCNTDGGVPGEVFWWGLDEETKGIDFERILNYAYRSTHTMTVIAKAVITAIYGVPPKYSYMQGASNGGRQALGEAQIYPEDYDGIWAVDPAININKLFLTGIWPLAVMHEEKHILTPTKLEHFRSAAIKQNSGRYDFIETADFPIFDPYGCIGEETADGIITEADAKIMKLLFDGPKTRDDHFMWYGFRPGTHFWTTGILGAPGSFVYKNTENGPEPQLGDFYNGYIGTWLKRDMSWDWKNLGYREFEEIFKQALRDLSCVECCDPDLYNFKKNGGKLLLTHAVNDDTIPSDGSLDYYKNVVERMGGEAAVNEFLCFFYTPGGGHTDMKLPGLSTTLADGMIALMKWVEDGEKPKVLSGIQYDFDQKAELITGNVKCYQLGQSNSGFDIQVTDAFERKKAKNAAGPLSRLGEHSTLAELMSEDNAYAILKEHIGAILDNPMIAGAKEMSIGQLKSMMPVDSIKEKISIAITALEKFK